jgi:DNA-binding GntR family transcriptional regulator
VSPQQWKDAVTDHEQMMEALERRDGKELGAVLRPHLRTKAPSVSEFVAGISQMATNLD